MAKLAVALHVLLIACTLQAALCLLIRRPLMRNNVLWSRLVGGMFTKVSNHCDWNGIYCNKAGSVIDIDVWYLKIPVSKELQRIQNLNLTSFPYLESLYLSGMGLTGTIPKEIGTLSKPSISFSSKQQSQTSKAKHIIVVALPVIGVILFGFIVILSSKRYMSKTKIQRGSSNNGDLFSIWNFDGKIVFEDIIEATEDFDIKYCIGTGAYGSVYKAQLPSGNIVALKKLHQMESQNPSFDKSFHNEVKMLEETS